MTGQRLFRFHEVAEAPIGAGVYAWYCAFAIAKSDLEACEKALKSAGEPNHVMREFLVAQLFGPLRERPYHVALSGKLKPAYRGEAVQDDPISPELVARLASNPSRLHAVNRVLAQAVPWFASPIYIGCSVSLRARLKQHVALITELRNGNTGVTEEPYPTTDHTFAYEAIVERGIDPNDLWVAVLAIDGIDRDAALDTENVLNRINFPLCGRN